jgi:cytochrome c-type biogenesis protein CcmH/NrfG
LKQAFDKLMMQGKTAATAKKFPDAIKAYEAALQLKPNDPEAAAALKRAREGKP